MNPSETLRFKLAIRDDLHRRHPHLSPAQEEALIAHLIKLKDVVTPKEDGSFTFLGGSLETAIDDVIGAGRGQAASPVAAVVPPTEEEAAAKLGGYELTEFRKLPGDQKIALIMEAKGDPGRFWPSDVRSKPHGLTAVEISRLTPEEKIALGNENARGQS
jgi:hypothetical protein